MIAKKGSPMRAADGFTPSGDRDRAIQAALKDALDDANDNRNFVQDSPCTFMTPY